MNARGAPGPAGKIFAMALSPDGKWLAAGGRPRPLDLCLDVARKQRRLQVVATLGHVAPRSPKIP
jgi:hypothetical protein